MANETEKTILPYLNVLEVETIDKSNVTKVIVIDKDDEVKVMDGSQLGTNSYFDIQNKPEINGVELNGSMTSDELGIPSVEGVDNQITEKLVDYPTKEEVTAEITEATSGKQDILIQGNGIVIDNNTISADYSTINNKPSLNGVELIKPTEIIPSIQIQSVPDKVTISSIFGNQTGNPEELPAYNTETNTAGIITATLYAQLADKYTKAEIDQLNIEINKAINAKQGILTAGANITIVDNVISAFQNHFFLNLDVNDPDRQLEIYNFIRSNMDFYLFGQITYNEDIIVVPMTVVVEHTNTIDLYGYYFKDNEVLVTINAIIVNNGQMTVKTTEVDLTNKGYTKEEVDEKLAAKQGVFTPQAPLAFNEDKSQLSVDLSGYQPVGDYATNDSVNEEIETLRSSLQSKIDAKQDKGDYALKSDIPTKVSELTNDSNFVTEAEVSGDLAGKADKTYVDEQLATKQPVGDYATKTELADKADSSVVESLSTQVATNTSDISVIKTKQEEDGNKIDALDKEMATKQDLLVSGTNIKTINGQDILGSGNLDISGGTTDYNQLTNKPQINSVELSGNKSLEDLGVPTKTSELTNDSGFLTSIPDEYVTETELNAGLGNKQDSLVSGTNIKTVNGESLLGSGNIDIESVSNPVTYGSGTQPQVHTILVVTQSEYDAISSKDPNTQYLIVE